MTHATAPSPIEIVAIAEFVEEQSDLHDDHYVFAYTIRITNRGEAPARLLSRHWVITDAHGQIQEVRGEGVVGQQPLLASGESFEYTSAAAIPTPNGTMEGSYRMELENGETFDAPIATFALTKRDTLH